MERITAARLERIARDAGRKRDVVQDHLAVYRGRTPRGLV